jgi:biopolymer transport protein ExbD
MASLRTATTLLALQAVRGAIFVSADGAVPYGRVVEAMDVARGAGAERMGIMSDLGHRSSGRPPSRNRE